MKSHFWLLALFLFASPSIAAETITLHGAIHADRDISAAAFFDNMLVIGGDEAVGKKNNENYIQLLEKQGNNYRVSSDILIYSGNKKNGRELDIEGIAVDDRHIYVTGSHALARKRVKPDNSYEKNLQRLQSIKPEPARKHLFRLTLDASGKVIKHEKTSLASIIRNDPILAPFAGIPSKENGIDIEGIAVKGGLIYLGFRGPVLRDGFAPVMRFDFDQPESSYRLLFLNLEGRGIRDMAAVSDGFLMLAGHVGDKPRSYRIYHWNGHDCIPGTDKKQQGKVTLLVEVDPPAGGKAEGIAVINETAELYNVIALFDGISGGSPRRYTISRPELDSGRK